ncbi:MAG TPA: tetratricopeptide repeat protein [Candidatus Angelobacter sp.]|nr:tetratricopeptide repeat protein [Candidatus Angelobacter sp.]
MKTRLLMVAFCFCATAWSQQSGFGKAYVSVPGVSGVLEFDPGPTRWETRVRSDGKETQLQAMGRPDHLLVTAFLQHVTFAASAESCRDEWWPATEKGSREHNIKLDHMQQTTQAGMARVEYVIPEVQGTPVRQKTVHAYLGARDLCAEIHLSKVQFVPEDQKLFDEVLATVRVRLDDSGTQDQTQANRVTAYFGQASRFFTQQNYEAAADMYQKALDLEKQKRTLNATLFRVLLDNLGMSYGLTGKLPKAKETFEYGIAQDPEYPMFYYNLACAYGEMGKMDESLTQLRLAYKYKANMIAGESFPDPMKDDSFRNFVKDKRFVDAVQQMQRPQ